jgi:opacity protein-like surface antigen
MKKGNATRVLLLVVVVLTATAGFAQAPAVVEIAANTAVPATQHSATVAVTATPSELQARIEAQQRQINELTALVQKLQASLEPVASTQAFVPTRNSVIGYFGGGSPNPLPSPSPNPSAPPVEAGYTAPRELLPDIGHIGAELGFFAGGATNPYKANKGFATGGFIDLPWKKVPGGKLSYEIMIGMQRSVTATQSTSGVNALVNAATWNWLCGAGAVNCTGENFPTLGAYLTGPLPVTSTVEERAKVLTVAPFELKYTITKMGRFRPYVVGGLGTYVWIGSDSNTKTFDANKSLGAYAGATVAPGLTLGNLFNSLLQGSQIGGLAPTSPELAARGVPHGQGNLLFGAQFGAGAEVRISPKLSIGVDFRHNQVEGRNASFNTFAFQQGLHW